MLIRLGRARLPDCQGVEPESGVQEQVQQLAKSAHMSMTRSDANRNKPAITTTESQKRKPGGEGTGPGSRTELTLLSFSGLSFSGLFFLVLLIGRRGSYKRGLARHTPGPNIPPSPLYRETRLRIRVSVARLAGSR